VIFSPHPKVSNAITEKSLFEKYNCIARILTIPTKDAVAVSQVVVTRVSTVAVKGLFMGKPAIYLDEKNTTFVDVVIANNLIPQVTNPSDFINQLCLLTANQFQFNVNQLESAGIPTNGIPTTLQIICSNKELSSFYCTGVQ